VTGLADGGFVVAWQSAGQDGDGWGVYGHRFQHRIVKGTDGDDTIEGGEGADFILGLAGNDWLNGHAGNDKIDGGAGRDTLDGGLGIDRAIYAGSDAGVMVNLADGDGTGGHAQGDRLTGIEHLTGSDHADTLIGDDGDNRLDGGAGADELNGGEGNDWAVYADSDGSVIVSLVAGTTGERGHAQDDTLTGIENLTGSDHADTLTGDDGDNRLDGGAGNDSLDGGAGIDRAIYAGSNAAVTVNLATGTGLGGFAQGDTLTGIEDLTGSDHADTLTGDDGDNRLDGGDGIDLLRGGAGKDILDGGAGIDWLTGGADEDTLDGGAGNDVFIGGAGRDILDGGEGRDRAIYRASHDGVSVNLATGTGEGGDAQGDTLTGIESLIGSDFADRLTGDDGNNRLEGGAGADTLDGGLGNDWLIGGAGADVFVFRPADGVVGDTITDFKDGTDIVRINGSSFGDLTMTDSGGDASVTWGENNTLTFAGLDHTLLTADDFAFV